MGHAIAAYARDGRSLPLEVLSPTLADDVMPMEVLFRTFHEMPSIEQHALEHASGRVLDVGAGAGCHSQVLQQRGIDVTALDVSALSVETMRKRGVKNAIQGDFFELKDGTYDTILMLMNGIGIVGRLKRMRLLFTTFDRLLAPGGQVLCDSSDLRFLYLDDEGNFSYDGNAYYGEHSFRMRYGDIEGKPFDWLYVDAETLAQVAGTQGYDTQVIAQGNHYDYLARITKRAVL